jgi:hypothetical protein
MLRVPLSRDFGGFGGPRRRESDPEMPEKRSECYKTPEALCQAELDYRPDHGWYDGIYNRSWLVMLLYRDKVRHLRRGSVVLPTPMRYLKRMIVATLALMTC